MQSLTIAENKAIEELRQRMKTNFEPNMVNDDLLLYRFLKARDFKLDQAEDMLKKDLAWRKINQVNRILKDYKPVEVLDKYLSYTILGFDKEGSPIMYNPTGSADIEGALKSATLNEMKQFYIRNMERECLLMKKQTEKLGKPVTQFIAINDLENFTFAKATSKRSMEIMLYFTALLQDHYPEIMKKIFVINAPFYFTLTFAIIKKIMSDAMIQKIHVFGSSGWQDALLQQIDAEVLPAFLGGKRTDPDGNPLCTTIINPCSTIPENYYICNSRKPLSRKTDTKKVVINPGSKVEIMLQVTEPETIIEWEFEIKSRDIGFGLSFLQSISNEKSNLIELIPIQKVHCSEGYETGRYSCEEVGTYIITFDNSYSWMQYKELDYRTTMTPTSKATTET